MRAATSTTTRLAVADDQLREGDPVLQPERPHRAQRHALGLLERVAEELRRDTSGSSRPRSRRPAGAAGRTGAAGTARRRARSTRPFSSSPSVNSSRIASPVGDSASAACRWRSRSSNDLSRKSPRWPPESAGLSTAGKPTVSAAGAASRRARTAANRGCGTPPSRELPAHRDLVRHQVRGIRADPGQAERLRDRGDDRNRPVGGHGQRAVDPEPARDLDHALDVDEVDDLGLVGMLEPGRLGVSVDGDDAQSELLRAQDRAPLVAPRADEENGLHSRAMLLGKQERHPVPARDLAAVSPGEPGRDTPAAERPAHERFLRPAVDLRADRRRRKGQERALLHRSEPSARRRGPDERPPRRHTAEGPHARRARRPVRPHGDRQGRRRRHREHQ